MRMTPPSSSTDQLRIVIAPKRSSVSRSGYESGAPLSDCSAAASCVAKAVTKRDASAYFVSAHAMTKDGNTSGIIAGRMYGRDAASVSDAAIAELVAAAQ